MQLILKKRLPEAIDLGLLYAVIALLALAAARCLPVLDIMPACAFRQLTGIPCPTCGATRSLVLLAEGDLAGSFFFNPAVPLTLIAIFLLGMAQFLAWFDRAMITFQVTSSEARLFRTGTVAALLANWAYLVLQAR